MTSNLREATLEPKLIGDIEGTFFVPSYQRGYRWGEVEVRRLLEDIAESFDLPYYLQPVVVKPHGDEWELVDGQQRLTTLYLVMQYMKNAGLQSTGASYSMRYETRTGSADYLDAPDPDRSQENIDYFHIHAAYKCISDWFEGHEHRRQHMANRFYGALFEQVRVIWYQAPDDADATTLFTRLNVGRIPLTDAELVKALLLSRCRDGDVDRALEVAAQWDAIERDLRQPDVWAFITGSARREPTHISLLLDTLAGGPAGRDRPLFHTFETLRAQIASDPTGFWERVVDLHSLVLGWYEDRNLFHKIGFLVSTGTSLAGLISSARGRRKSEFEAELDRLIRLALGLSESALRDLDYGSAATERALLLMNVETVRLRQHSSERYSFREHAVGGWSLEHIHAQNAERLNKAEQWVEWLRLHDEALAALPEAAEGTYDDLRTRIAQARVAITEAKFRALEQELTEIFSSSDDTATTGVHSIANLALLDRDTNSALNNGVFEVKRRAIIARDKAGDYIPVCTRNAFLKYYTTAEAQQIQFWGAQDMEGYLNELVSTLSPYLGVAPAPEGAAL